MVHTISDTRVFFVNMKDPEGHDLYEMVNPLAHEVKVVAVKENRNILSWFDMANQSMRSIPISALSTPTPDSYIIKDSLGNTYTFQYINKQIYETYIHPICAGSPLSFDTDEEVQRWLLTHQ